MSPQPENPTRLKRAPPLLSVESLAKTFQEKPSAGWAASCNLIDPVPVGPRVTQMDSGGIPTLAVPDPLVYVTAILRIDEWPARTESPAGHTVSKESPIVQRTLP